MFLFAWTQLTDLRAVVQRVSRSGNAAIKFKAALGELVEVVTPLRVYFLLVPTAELDVWLDALRSWIDSCAHPIAFFCFFCFFSFVGLIRLAAQQTIRSRRSSERAPTRFRDRCAENTSVPSARRNFQRATNCSRTLNGEPLLLF